MKTKAPFYAFFSPLFFSQLIFSPLCLDVSNRAHARKVRVFFFREGNYGKLSKILLV
jgi:hypothetical protein